MTLSDAALQASAYKERVEIAWGFGLLFMNDMERIESCIMNVQMEISVEVITTMIHVAFIHTNGENGLVPLVQRSNMVSLEEKFEELFWQLEVTLLENNVAVEVIDKNLRHLGIWENGKF